MSAQRIASPAPRVFAALMLVLSAICAVAVLATRNFYDDELLSLPIITNSPHAILHFSNTADVHPAGMYLLAHVALYLMPSFRWMNLLPTAVFYVGLTVFVLSLAPRFQQTASRTLFLLLATLHPQLFLWGTSYRWYSWWTGLALTTLVIALQPRHSDPKLSLTRSAVIGVLLAALFYINYITLLFALALIASAAVRYGRTNPNALKTSLIATAVFVILIAPQVHILLRTHIAHSSAQRISILGSFARLAQATFASEGYLPWHPLAVATAITFAGLLAAGLWIRTRSATAVPEETTRSPLRSISFFAVTFFLLVAISGLGGKPRNGLLLVPVFALMLAHVGSRLPTRVQQAATVLVLVWSAVGIGHMLARTGLTKSMMIERPEQVAAFIRSTAPYGCAVIVTSDAPLAFAVSHPQYPRTILLSQFTTPIANSAATLASECTHARLYIAHTYVVGSTEWAASLESELDSAASLIEGPPHIASFSPDPDAARKRALGSLPGFGTDLGSVTRLPDYRYTVVSGPIDRSALQQLRSRLPDLCLPEECLSPTAPDPQ